MDESGLVPEQVLPLLDDEDPILRNTAEWVVGHRPVWGISLVEHFRSRLQQQLSEEERNALAGQLAQLARSPAIQQLLAAALREGKTGAERSIAMQAMSSARLTATPPSWLDALTRELSSAEGEALSQAVLTAQALPLPKGGHAALQESMRELGRRREVAIDVRLAALTAAGDVGELDSQLFDELRTCALPGEAMEVRGAAATVLARARLNDQQRLALVETIKDVGPLELPKLLPAFERDPGKTTGEKLVAALEESAGFRGLRADLLRPLLEKYPPEVQQVGEKLLERLNVSAAEQAALLDRIARELPLGDLRRGHEVFVSKKAACSSCHAVGYLGGRLGPDLTAIGKVRNERDLLESIVYPSASLVRSYETVLVEMEDGRVATGILISESADEIVLALDPQRTLTIARGEVAEVHPTNVSLMPTGIANLLTRQELADLIAYLRQPK
jgi:putative heme-binding domain-containing protein